MHLHNHRDRYHTIQHHRDIALYEKRLKEIYEQAAREAVRCCSGIDSLSDDLFTFDQFPITHERIDRLLADLNKQTYTLVADGIRGQWALANDKNNWLCQQVFGDSLNSLTEAEKTRYFNNNDTALQAFLTRKVQGLNLSDRVWRYTTAYKSEIEMALDYGIRNGQDAASIARDLKQYLVYPDKLFRRVRDQHGNLVLSKAARAFHPGQGVYRSSYMNARRLAATETNIAYRSADHERHQQLDFVVGIEIHLSNNHTCKGVKGDYYDICDELQGRYPKDFKFVGWHPHCRCYVTSILKTPAELRADVERIKHGEPTTTDSENAVSDVPPQFKDWISGNADRIATAKQLPYFLWDNGARVDGKYHLMDFTPKVKSIADIAAERHAARSPEQAAAIMQRWNGQHSQALADNAALMAKAQRTLTVATRYGIDPTDLQKAIGGTRFTMPTSQFSTQAFTRYNKATLAAVEAAMQDVRAKALQQALAARQALLAAREAAAKEVALATKRADNFIKMAAAQKDLDASALQAALAKGDITDLKQTIDDFQAQVDHGKQAALRHVRYHPRHAEKASAIHRVRAAAGQGCH